MSNAIYKVPPANNEPISSFAPGTPERESLKSKFVSSISQYWPDIDPKKLHPDYTGIRPKITKPNESTKDFSIQTQNDHGIENFINLQGIESPGLTSSLAIAKYVADYANF
mgnify:CR=1 FL=1